MHKQYVRESDVDSTYEFSIAIDATLKDYRGKIPLKKLEAIEEYLIEVFKAGYYAGQLSHNKPISI